MKKIESSSAQLAAAVCEALDEGKARDVALIPVAHLTGGFFERIAIATATSARHALALSDRVMRAARKCAVKPTVEGRASGEWVLIDAGALIVHIMQEDARKKYDLEGLWGFTPAAADDDE
jgi:ribosome-associated protein